MKNYILVVVTLFGINPLFSQELIVDSGVVLKKGAYRNFEEFKYNNPSLKYSTEVESMELKAGLLGYLEAVTYYGIGKKVEQKHKSHELFGFCDGESVYIHSLNYISKDMSFVKLKKVGLYSFYEYIYSRPKHSIVYFFRGGGIPRKNERVLNINNGLSYPGSRTFLDSLFKKDETLAKALNTDGANFEELVNEYSVIHKDEIERNPPVGDNIYMTSADSTLLDYENRMIGYQSDPIIFEIKIIKNYYNNDQLKFFGVWAKHRKGRNWEYPYDIGTAFFFYENGQIKEEINYNWFGKKEGKNSTYSEDGELIKVLSYVDGELVQ
jgi:hypothetical protein